MPRAPHRPPMGRAIRYRPSLSHPLRRLNPETRKPAQSRSGQNPAADYDAPMTVTLPPALNQLVDRLVHTGRYADEGDVVREALRVLERQEFDESPALEAAILEGVHSPHQRYDASVMDRIRQNARSIA